MMLIVPRLGCCCCEIYRIRMFGRQPHALLTRAPSKSFDVLGPQEMFSSALIPILSLVDLLSLMLVHQRCASLQIIPT